MALPSGYTQLKYIRSSGAQYINTGFKPSGKALRVVMKFRYTAAYSSLSLFGNHTSAPYSMTVYGARPTFWVGNSSDVSCGPQTEQGVDYTLDATAQNGTITAIWNGTKYTAAYSGNLYTEQPIFIFGGNSNGALAEAGNGYQLEMYQLYDDGALVRDYVPAQNSAGEIGLYDKAEGVFESNAGSGTFTAGPIASGPVDGEGAVILAGVSFAIKEGTAMLNGAARKITEGMTILGGTAKKIAVASGIDVAAMVISYTGAYTDQKDVTMSGKKYRLLTLTGSGTLKVEADVTASVWMCGGGGAGTGGYIAYSTGASGGGGGNVIAQNEMVLPASGITAVVGAGGIGSTNEPTVAGSTTFGNLATTAVQSCNGASGGGAGGHGATAGVGAGKSTKPFPLASVVQLQYAHSAGGGGGHLSDGELEEESSGGNGGTNGSNGSKYNDERGGDRGGGNGGVGNRGAGTAATFYGSGGGGGANYFTRTGSSRPGSGGNGYQGVIYIMIPYEQ